MIIPCAEKKIVLPMKTKCLDHTVSRNQSYDSNAVDLPYPRVLHLWRIQPISDGE